LLSGSESVDLENPVEIGGVYLYKQALTLVNDPNPSLTPEENTLQLEEEIKEETIINDNGKEIEIIEEETVVTFE
jgi:hypothetical protein